MFGVVISLILAIFISNHIKNNQESSYYKINKLIGM